MNDEERRKMEEDVDRFTALLNEEQDEVAEKEEKLTRYAERTVNLLEHMTLLVEPEEGHMGVFGHHDVDAMARVVDLRMRVLAMGIATYVKEEEN